MRRTEVGPFAQIGLAQDHRTGLAQAPHQERVLAGPEILQRQRAGGGGHGHGVDVVLQQHRDAVQRPAHRIGTAFHVAQRRFLQRVRVQFYDGVELRPGLVDGGDPIQVRLRQPPAVQFPGLHARLQVGDVELGVPEVGRRRRGRRTGGRRRLAGSQGEHQAKRQPRSAHADTCAELRQATQPRPRASNPPAPADVAPEHPHDRQVDDEQGPGMPARVVVQRVRVQRQVGGRADAAQP